MRFRNVLRLAADKEVNCPAEEAMDVMAENGATVYRSDRLLFSSLYTFILERLSKKAD